MTESKKSTSYFDNLQRIAEYVCRELKDDVTKPIQIPGDLVLWLDEVKEKK